MAFIVQAIKCLLQQLEPTPLKLHQKTAMTSLEKKC